MKFAHLQERSLWFATALTLLFGLGASAAETESPVEDSTRSGPYIGLSAAGALPMTDGGQFVAAPSDGFLLPSSCCDYSDTRTQPAIGLNARAGWRILRYLAAEVQYEWAPEIKTRLQGSTIGKIETQVITANVRLIAPFDSLQPYLLAGVGAARYQSETLPLEIDNSNPRVDPPANLVQPYSKQTEWDLAGRLGAGLDMYVTQHLVVNVEISGVLSDKELMDERWSYISVSGGLQYRF